jgi:hypothetical protein
VLMSRTQNRLGNERRSERGTVARYHSLSLRFMFISCRGSCMLSHPLCTSLRTQQRKGVALTLIGDSHFHQQIISASSTPVAASSHSPLLPLPPARP